MLSQFTYLKQDVKRALAPNKFRIIYIWFSRFFWGITLYRFERSMFLLIGKQYSYIRIIFMPLYYLVQAYSNIEIPYLANIEGGVYILHPSVGVVISGRAVIGKNLTLTGGNIIGAKPGTKMGDIIIGDNCLLGANSTVIGPIKLGNNIETGSLACVVKDCLIDGSVLIGVPAKILEKKNS